jgi:hypothetical protein
MRQRVIEIAHEGHQGVTKTKKLLRTKVWFPKLDSMVEKYIDSCVACRINHPRTYFQPLQMSNLPNSPFEEVSVDFYGPTPSNTELLVFIDDYSRFAIVVELPNIKVDTVIPALHGIISTFGIPRILKSDNGPTFTSHELERFCKYFGIDHRFTTPYWPRANGEVERFMRNINKVMRNASVLSTCWRKEMNLFLGAYRSTPHSSTGVPPAQLVFKFNHTQRLAQICQERSFERNKDDDIALENDKIAKLKMKQSGDKHLRVKEADFRVGDKVLYQEPSRRLRNKQRSRRVVDDFEITDIKGSMITVKSLSTGKVLTRNSSCFIRSTTTTTNLQQHEFISIEDTFQQEDRVGPPIQIQAMSDYSERRLMHRYNRGQIDRLVVNFNNKTYT